MVLGPVAKVAERLRVAEDEELLGPEPGDRGRMGAQRRRGARKCCYGSIFSPMAAASRCRSILLGPEVLELLCLDHSGPSIRYTSMLDAGSELQGQGRALGHNHARSQGCDADSEVDKETAADPFVSSTVPVRVEVELNREILSVAVPVTSLPPARVVVEALAIVTVRLPVDEVDVTVSVLAAVSTVRVADDE
jgi:hypothetical protein